MKIIKPTCRYCGNRTLHFGDICDDCRQERELGPFDDYLVNLTQQQNNKIIERMATT